MTRRKGPPTPSPERETMADADETPRIHRDWMEALMFRGSASRRFTQDSPVLPDVWLRFADRLSKGRTKRVDLLLTPHRDSSAPDLCVALRDRLAEERESRHWRQWHDGDDAISTDMAYHQSSVVAKLSFDELVRVVLPLSSWWREIVPGRHDDLGAYLASRTNRARVLTALEAMTAEDSEESDESPAPPPPRPRTPVKRSPHIPPDLLWMIRMSGTMMLASGAMGDTGSIPRTARQFLLLSRKFDLILELFRGLIDDAQPPAPTGSHLYTVARNRRVTSSIARSVMAVKGDAARRVFALDTRNIAWAILDSGIDATHQAFRKLDEKTGRPFPEAFTPLRGSRGVENNTSIVATFNFANIRTLLNPDVTDSARRAQAAVMTPSVKRSRGAARPAPAALPQASAHAPDRDVVALRAGDLTRRLLEGRAIDWDELAPLLTIPYDNYVEPDIDHGTHVAGILGGRWRHEDWPGRYPADESDDLVGVCPGLAMYDFRVLGADGYGDEFTVMAALQFIRHMNAHRDQPAVHGANLSLSLKHDVANYACGRTPVCDECERVVSSGVVVVAAAGNDGYQRVTTPSGEAEGYRSISISDPGNADTVITVGATHRSAPHTYGVSYFSSRGPTGDGRIKPDLVAPGEKITAPIIGDRAGTKDGTSMAAPHVSGAAVLLMARHRELLGNPARVKRILCDTATDLGRERYFQGAGMVDILRALQSV